MYAQNHPYLTLSKRENSKYTYVTVHCTYRYSWYETKLMQSVCVFAMT